MEMGNQPYTHIWAELQFRLVKQLAKGKWLDMSAVPDFQLERTYILKQDCMVKGMIRWPNSNDYNKDDNNLVGVIWEWFGYKKFFQKMVGMFFRKAI